MRSAAPAGSTPLFKSASALLWPPATSGHCSSDPNLNCLCIFRRPAAAHAIRWVLRQVVVGGASLAMPAA